MQRTAFGHNRADITAIAEKLGVSERKAIHIAVARLYIDLFEDTTEVDYPSDEAFQAYYTKHGEPEPLEKGKPGVKSLLDYL